ncbi:MAG: large conductance mechanosensitive channel protein MscL [Erysipelotrichales bacterium]|nr:large conductance mechanosensitive channel protein MscL [Erysipelotrichales bacterium]
MKKFFKEFKDFISKGNILDMAVGIIIGGAFSAIVTALTNQILMPCIKWIISLFKGGDGLENAVSWLTKVEKDGAIDWENSIYIDWGAFITAIINFLLIALVLFIIIKLIMGAKKKMEELKKKDEPVVEEAPQPEPEPVVDEHVELLKEIRDLLKEDKSKK